MTTRLAQPFSDAWRCGSQIQNIVSTTKRTKYCLCGIGRRMLEIDSRMLAIEAVRYLATAEPVEDGDEVFTKSRLCVGAEWIKIDVRRALVLLHCRRNMIHSSKHQHSRGRLQLIHNPFQIISHQSLAG